MRKSFVLAAIVAVAVGAAVWSVSTRATPKATEASAPVSPHDITVKQGNSLPVEYWTHPF